MEKARHEKSTIRRTGKVSGKNIFNVSIRFHPQFNRKKWGY